MNTAQPHFTRSPIGSLDEGLDQEFGELEEEFEEGLRLIRNVSKDNDLKALTLPDEVTPEEKTKSKLRDVGLVLIAGLCFCLPLILFTFFKPVRSVFSVIGDEIGFMEGNFANYILLCAVGSLILVFGVSPLLYDILLGYSLQSFWKAYLVALVYRFFGFIFTHLLSKAIFYGKIMRFFENSSLFHALRYLARKRPFSTLCIIRFAHIPTFMANYGIPIFGYTLTENLIVGMLFSLIWVTIGISFGLSAKSIEELKKMKPSGGPTWLKYLPFFVTALGVFLMVYMFFYARKRIMLILRKYELEELKLRLERGQVSYGALGDQ